MNTFRATAARAPVLWLSIIGTVAAIAADEKMGVEQGLYPYQPEGCEFSLLFSKAPEVKTESSPYRKTYTWTSATYYPEDAPQHLKVTCRPFDPDVQRPADHAEANTWLGETRPLVHGPGPCVDARATVPVFMASKEKLLDSDRVTYRVLYMYGRESMLEVAAGTATEHELPNRVDEVICSINTRHGPVFASKTRLNERPAHRAHRGTSAHRDGS